MGVGMNVTPLCDLVWGQERSPVVFNQWLQPLQFSPSEPTALIQHLGGPCSVLAPLQAYVIKHLLFPGNQPSPTVEQFSEISSRFAADFELQKRTLIEVLTQLLEKVTLKSGTYCVITSKFGLSTQNIAQVDDEMFNAFHSSLLNVQCSSKDELQRVLNDNLPAFLCPGGVLLLLYSLIFTRGISQIKSDIGVIEADNPLIDPVHGHGAVCITTLCITGAASTNLFDGDKSLDGLPLKGVSERPEVGYLSILEHYRYLQVGSYMKQPLSPLWVLASETHLTLLFALDKSLAYNSCDQVETAREEFKKLDADCCGFIDSSKLPSLLQSLQLPHDDSSVQTHTQSLDPEQLGIITLASFLQHFYPGSTDGDSTVVTDIPVYHYNGLTLAEGGRGYSKGMGVLGLSPVELTPELANDEKLNLIVATKWPTLQITWDHIPSVD